MTSTNMIRNDYQYSSDNKDTVIHTPLSPSLPLPSSSSPLPSSLSLSPIVGTRAVRATNKRKTMSSSSSSDSNWSSDSDRTDDTSDDSDADSSSSSSSSSRKAKKARSTHVSSLPRASSLSVASANRPRYTKKGSEFRGKGRTGGEKCLTREAKMAIMQWCIDNWDRGVGQPNYKGPIADRVEMDHLAAISGVSYEQVVGFLRNFRQRHFKQGIVYYRQRLHQLVHGRKPVSSPAPTPTQTRRTKKALASSSVKEESKTSLATECTIVSPVSSLSSQTSTMLQEYQTTLWYHYHHYNQWILKTPLYSLMHH